MRHEHRSFQFPIQLFAAGALVALLTAPVSAQVVISQVYGGGGQNSQSPYENDFIELYNRGTTGVSLNGWSVQYAGSGGSTWTRTNLTNVTLGAGKYYLIQQASAGPDGILLPTADATGTTNMAQGAGKVALVNTQTTITSGVSCPTGATIVDFVGYGTAANCFEGTGPTASGSAANANHRKSNGCTDTNDNTNDFTVAAPNPRNTSTAAFGPCVDVGVTMSDSPDPVGAGSLLTYTITVTNNSASTSNAISIADTLPAQVTYQSCSIVGGTGGACSGTGNNRTITFTSIAGSSSATITLTALVNCNTPAATSISNTATATMTGDTNSANNSATATTLSTADSTLPVISVCASNQSVNADASCQGVVPTMTGGVTATDNCTASGSLVITQSPAAGTLAPLGPNTVTISVRDAANNVATCNATLTVVDATAPNLTCPGTVTVSAGASYTALIPNLTGLASATDNCSGTVTITQSPAAGTSVGLGSHTVTIEARDAALNMSSCSTTVNVVDDTPPNVVFTSSAPDPTNVSPIPVTATFSETVTGLLSSEIAPTNGTITSFTPVSGTVYTFNIVPIAQGLVAVDLAANAAQDPSGNGNTPATQLSRVYDSISPTTTVATTASNPTNISPIPVTVTFDEPVVGFTLSSVLVTNGTLTNFAGSGASYSFDVVPSGSGLTVSASVSGGACTDAAGNPCTASSVSRLFNNVNPTTAMTSVSSDPTNDSPIVVDVTFSAAVSGFTLSDVVVTNATKGNFSTINASNYQFELTPTADGTVTADIAAGVCQDASTNQNLAAPTFSRVADSIAPTLALSSSATDPTNVSPISVTATFSEDVPDFDLSDVTPVNGTLSNFNTVSGSVYTFDLTPTAEGTIQATVSAGAANDLAGNPASGDSFSIDYDSISPTLVLSSTTSSTTNVSPIPVQAMFTEDVAGFDATDITPTNALVNNFTPVGGGIYTFDLSPLADGPVSATVAASAAADFAGNPASGDSISRTFDGTIPTVSLTTTSGNPTNSAPIPATATFSEDVVGFNATLVTAGGATVSNFVPVSGSLYTFDLVPSGQGTVTADIAAGATADAASNPNTAATTLSVLFDSISPDVVVASTASNPTNVSPIPFSFSFTESVTGFDSTDINVSGGTISSFIGSGPTYMADIVPSGVGVVSVDLAAGAGVDGAGNSSTASNLVTRFFNNVRPTVALSSVSTDPTNDSPIVVNVVFSANVTGFDMADLISTNSSLSNFVAVDGANYHFDLAPLSEGACSVEVPVNVAQDVAANQNLASPLFERTFDVTSPGVAVTTSEPDPTNSSNVLVDITFTEDVAGFASGEVILGNATLNSFTPMTSSTFQASIAPIVDGAVTVDVDNAVAQDQAGNDNTSAPQLSLVYDSIAPISSLSTTASSPTNLASILMTATFDEPVTGFVSGDIIVSNATVGSFTPVSAQVFDFTLTPAADGSVSAALAAGVADDLAGNATTNSALLSVVYDGTAPSVAMSSLAPDPASVSPIIVDVLFSESVTGFDASDIVATNAAVTNFAGSGDTYVFDLVPAANGSVTASIGASAALDTAGNASTAATQFSRTFTSSQPTVSMSSISSEPTNDDPIPVHVTFSENVSGFILGDITTTNGTATNFVVIDGANYTFDLDPTAPGTTTATIPAGVAFDSFSNPNFAAPTFERTFDNSAPTASFALLSANPTNGEVLQFQLTFSEIVGASFAVGDLTVTGAVAATITNVTNADPDFTIEVTATNPNADGALGLTLATSVQDLAGNPLPAPLNSAQYLIDNTSPDTSVIGPSGNVSQVSPVISVDYAAVDAGSGFSGPLAGVQLYYQRTGLRSFVPYGGVFPVSGGTGTIPFDTSTTGGDAMYELYTVGVDVVGNTEAAPVSGGDVTIIFSTVPASVVDWMVLSE